MKVKSRSGRLCAHHDTHTQETGDYLASAFSLLLLSTALAPCLTLDLSKLNFFSKEEISTPGTKLTIEKPVIFDSGKTLFSCRKSYLRELGTHSFVSASILNFVIKGIQYLNGLI